MCKAVDSKELTAFAFLEKGMRMGQIISEALQFAMESTHEYWNIHRAGYLREFIAIVIFGIIGTIIAAFYEKIEEQKRKVKQNEASK